MKLGGDLSNYDWPLSDSQVAEMRAAGWERVIVGCQREDPALGLVRACRDGGLRVTDLYVYLYWGYAVAPEVMKAVGVAKQMGGISRIWLDCEADGEAQGQTPESRVAQLRHAVGMVTDHGFAAGIYTGGWFWPSAMGNTTEFARLPLWHAAYFDDRRIVETVNYGGWSSLAVHQYASTPALAGRNRDYDAFFEEETEMTPIERTMLEAVYRALTGGTDEAAAARITEWNANGNSLLLGYTLEQQKLAEHLASGAAGAIPDHTHEPGGVQR